MILTIQISSYNPEVTLIKVDNKDTEDKKEDMMEDKTTKNITPNDLMVFLESFKVSMESKIEDAKGTIEDKIDGRLNNIDKEIENINSKIDTNDEVNKRMDRRLMVLEQEMRKSSQLNRRSEELRTKERELACQPVGRCQDKSSTKRSVDTNKLVCVSDKPEVVRKLNNDCCPASGNPKDMAGDKEDRGRLSSGSFRSSWAMEMERDLQLQAEKLTIQPEGSREKTTHATVNETPENTTKDIPAVPDNWEDRDELHRHDHWEEWDMRRPAAGNHDRKEKQKIRKPIVITTWFGDTSEEDDTDSDSSDGWTEVERKRKNTERRRRTKRMKKEKEVRCAAKAACMAGVGPIKMSDIMNLVDGGMKFEDAKIEVLHNFLKENLGFNDTELSELSLVETKFATKGDNVLNVAMSNQEHIRELHIRRAESQNDRIIVRNFISPNFYKRYMTINRICTDRRAEDPRLKTQLRFGKSDVELFTKYRGEESGYRHTKLEDFMDTYELPRFDHDLKWRKVAEKPPRRKINYGTNTVGRSNSKQRKESQAEVQTPAIRQTGIVRANSNSTSNELKKHKPSSPSSSSSSSGEDEDMDDSRNTETDSFSTPTGSKAQTE